MSEANTGPEFLQKKYQMNIDPGVVATAKRHSQRSGDQISQGNYPIRIQNYLDRLNNIINPRALGGRHDFDRKQRNLDMLKRDLHGQFVIKSEEIPEAYFDSIKRKHREEGYGDIEIPQDYRQDLAETVINDQKKSLDTWVDYLASDDAKYPDYLKYFAFRSILHMGRYDKQKKSFTERTGGTVNPFPDLNREALAIVLEAFERQSKGESIKFGYDIQEDVKKNFLLFLKNKNFAKLYALAVEELKPIPEELLKITEGKWVKYPRGSDHMPLVKSISNYGTGWCLRGEAMAQRYLVRDKNDLHVYYSFDKNGKPVVPRLVMVVNADGKITEFRGVAEQENHDEYIGNVVQVKLAEPEFEKEGKSYQKKAQDMRFLTAIENKIKKRQDVTRDDLIFLYEINAPIEHFGYQPKDPRIAELRSQRNPQEDMPVVFGCDKSQIAQSVEQINKDTKAYVGVLTPGIFDAIQRYNIEHVYTSFPEGKIRIEGVEIGGKSVRELEQELQQANINVSEYTKEDILHSKEFTTLPNRKMLDTVRLKVADLLPGNPTTDQIYAKAKELGLELVPAETGVHYRLKYKDQPMNEYLYMGMKQIAGRSGRPGVFGLYRGGDGLWLDGGWAGPDRRWDPERELMFALSKSEPKKLGLLDRFLKR